MRRRPAQAAVAIPDAFERAVNGACTCLGPA